MKKLFKLINAMVIAIILCIMPVASAFAESPSLEAEISQENSGAQGSASEDFHSSGTLYIEMREDNPSVDVYVQVVASTSADFNQQYYVAWTTPSGHIHYISNVLGNGQKYYFGQNISVEKGTHKFYFRRWDGNNSQFLGVAFIRNA